MAAHKPGFPFPLPVSGLLPDRKDEVIITLKKAMHLFPDPERMQVTVLIAKIEKGEDLSPTEMMMLSRAAMKANQRSMPFPMPFCDGKKIKGVPKPYPYPWPLPREPKFEEIDGAHALCEFAEDCPVAEAGKLDTFTEADITSCEYALDYGCPLMFKQMEEVTQTAKFEQKLEAAPNGTYRFTDFEVFMIGIWNEQEFVLEDLEDIAKNFHLLKHEERPALILGHDIKNSKEIMKNSSLPSFGEAFDVRVRDGRLFVDLENVPGKILDVLKKRAFRDRSISLKVNYRRKGKKFRLVLDHIGLLGVKHAAVKGLESLDDILALYSDEESVERQTILLSEIHTEEDETMPKELEKKLKAQEEANKKLLGEAAAQKKKFTELESENKDLKKVSGDKAKNDDDKSSEAKKKVDEESKKFSEELTKKLDDQADANKKLLEEVEGLKKANEVFSESIRSSKVERRSNDHDAWFTTQVKAGKLLPKDKETVMSFMNLVAGLDDIVAAKEVKCFAWEKNGITLDDSRRFKVGDDEKATANSAISMFQQMIDAFPKRIDFGSRSKDPKVRDDLENSNVPSDRVDVEVWRKIREAGGEDKLSYADALEAVTIQMGMTAEEINC